jgi:stalled ribosome rescue protein Dom34
MRHECQTLAIIGHRIGASKIKSSRGHKPPVDLEFFESVIKSLDGVPEILVIGPAQTKDELAAFARSKHPDNAKFIVAVESADHPSDAQLLAYAQKHFKVIDRMI